MRRAVYNLNSEIRISSVVITDNPARSLEANHKLNPQRKPLSPAPSLRRHRLGLFAEESIYNVKEIINRRSPERRNTCCRSEQQQAGRL